MMQLKNKKFKVKNPNFKPMTKFQKFWIFVLGFDLTFGFKILFFN